MPVFILAKDCQGWSYETAQELPPMQEPLLAETEDEDMKLSGTGGAKGFRGHYLVWLTRKEMRILADMIEARI